MSMNEKIYLIGQISSSKPETYRWRENIINQFRGDDRILFIDPCSNGFNQKILADNINDPLRKKIYKMRGTELLVPKDKSYVVRSTMGIANMNIFDPKKPIIGTFFELAWYLDYPEKAVIGILNGDPENDVICNHPFVRESVTIWVRDEYEACELVHHYYQCPRGKNE